MFSFPIKNDSYDKAIKDRYFHENMDHKKNKYIRVLNYNYGKAPYFKNTINLITQIFEDQETNVSKFIENQLKIICKYLGIKTPFINSELWKADISDKLSTEERVVKKLKVLEKIGMDHFINPIGGKYLYTKNYFKQNGIKLSYLKSKDISYNQFDLDFIPNLSIVDVMMFNSLEEIQKMLTMYELV